MFPAFAWSQSSASLDHIITWNLTCTNTCTMQSSTRKVHWAGAECNNHVLISCTAGGDLLTYRKGQVVGGRPGELTYPKQLPRIQSKLSVITSPTAQETHKAICQVDRDRIDPHTPVPPSVQQAKPQNREKSYRKILEKLCSKQWMQHFQSELLGPPGRLRAYVHWHLSSDALGRNLYRPAHT